MIRYSTRFCQTILLLTLILILPIDSYAFPDTCYEAYPYSMILVLQAELIQQGFNPGPIDGMWGSKTRKAVNSFQRAKGIRYAAEIKGMPNGETLRKLFGAKFKPDKYGLIQDDQLSQDIYEKYCK